MTEPIACIDFGTSNSAVSILDKNGEIHMLKIEDDNYLLPSAMFFYYDFYDKTDENNFKVFFGHEAEKMQETNHDAGRFMRSFKSLLGPKTFEDGTSVFGNPVPVPFANIIAIFLARLKLLIDIYAKQNVKNVIFGRPVHFIDNNKTDDQKAEDALRAIAEQIGFKHIAFQYEPVAAAFAHKQKILSETNQNAIIIDIGGGTSDFSIITTNSNTKPISNTGIHIGGNDFDEQFSLNVFMPMYGKGTSYKPQMDKKHIPIPNSYYINLSKWIHVHAFHDMINKKEEEALRTIFHDACDKEKVKYLEEIYENKLGFVNLSKVEETKIKLSEQEKTHVDFDFFEDSFQHTFKRSEFEKSIKTNIQKIIDTIKECVSKAKLNNKDIDIVIFTGGSTKIPYIQKEVKNLFKKATFIDSDAMTSVCSGLAQYAKENSDKLFN